MGNYRTFPYYGGKRGYGKAEWIASFLPHTPDSCYIEPFAGMTGVLLARPPVDIEILNDDNGRIVNWWMTVIDESEEFGRLIDFMLFSRAEFRWAKANMDNPDLTPLRRALAFHVVVEQAVVHSYMISGGWGAENYSRCRVCGKDSGGTYSGDSREVTRCAA